jgi:hypothetical protein
MAEIGAREINMRMIPLTAIHVERLAKAWDEAWMAGEDPEPVGYNVPLHLSVCELFDAQAEPGWREKCIEEGIELGIWPIEGK